MGPPANYPDFEGLAEEIADGTAHGRKAHEPIERFLGRLQDEGVPVHNITKSRLADSTSKPNPLHTAILRLFSGSAARVVTTNFDDHFSTEANRLFPKPLEIHNAPALPVGSRFEGLVYIHGSIHGPAERLVLTDGDFGRAYLTEGWARRFLQDTYANFTVLFIGYSHNDIVLQYLARGLPRNNARRFALCPAKSAADWAFLGIRSVTYPKRPAPDEHGALREAVEAWADLACMGALDHEDRIKKLLVTAPPIVGSEDDDYMRSVVEDEERVHFFVRSAKGKEWLLWAEERGLLAPLFSRRTDRNKRVWTLADWFAKEYVLALPEEALGVFERQGQILGQSLWYEIARNLHAKSNPDTVTLTKWLPILLEQQTAEDPADLLEYLFHKASGMESWTLLVHLFEHLTRPRVALEKSMSFFGSGRRDSTPTSAKVRILGSHHWLKDVLDKVLRPHMPSLAENLVRVTSQNIRRAHDLGALYGNANREWEGLSFQRSAIEPHSQDDLKHDFDIVIDACRDGLEWLLTHKRSTARGYIQEWILSPAPLLRRLAVHGMNSDNRRTPDQKLRWVVKHELVSSTSLHHEVFLLLKNVYPLTTKECRRSFWDHARAATLAEIKENPDQDAAMYWHGFFTLLSWLDQAADGKCPLVRSRLRRLRKQYPAFQMSDHPDFTHWSGGVRWGSESPVTADSLADKPVKEAIRLLATFKGERFHGPSRDGLLSALSTAVTQKPDWGMKIARELLKRRKPHADIWNRIFWGWAEAALTETQWRAILNLVDQNPRLTSHAHSVTQLLERGARKDKQHLPHSLLPLAERIGSRLWTVAARKRKAREKDSDDWLQTAINETGGDLAEFFMMAVSLRRKEAGTKWRGIPRKLKSQLERMLRDRTYTGEMARVLLASQVHFLYSSDPSWAENHVIPLLSWRRGTRQAVQAWHGYLFWGKWYDELLPQLLPLYERGFPRLHTDLQHVHERFVDHVASICFFSSRRKARGSWLNAFLRAVEPADRVLFAESIRKTLWDLPDKQVQEVWKKWLEPYWSNRLLGKPVPLAPDEASKMAEWAPHLAPVFSEFVSKVVSSPTPVSVDSFVYHMLSEKGVPAKHPKATAEFLSRVLPNSYEVVHDHGDLDKLLDELVKHKATHKLLRAILDHMASKGSVLPGKYLERFDGVRCARSREPPFGGVDLPEEAEESSFPACEAGCSTPRNPDSSG
ncbi:MAG: DUF4020 domain-containing protein [Gammaproteobacteria bacterium]|nr:DUF4020 domain-containing protein [Gammaproteobacteria bacterium]